MVRVVDTLDADTFLVAFHHPDGRKMYSNEELTYDEMAKQYDLDRPMTPGDNRPEDAAELWAEKVWHHTDYADELEAIVTSPDGTKHRIHITVEARPHFHATKIK